MAGMTKEDLIWRMFLLLLTKEKGGTPDFEKPNIKLIEKERIVALFNEAWDIVGQASKAE